MLPHRILIAAGDCGSRNLSGFGCGAERDGGSMYFEPLAESEALQMRVSDTARRFRMTWGCADDEEDQYEVLLYDPASPTIRMDKTYPKACAPFPTPVPPAQIAFGTKFPFHALLADATCNRGYPMFTRHSLIVAAALCAFVPALAQDKPQDKPDKPDLAAQPSEMRATAAYPTRQDAGQWLGLSLIGAKVVSTSNDSVGKIANLVVNENGAVDAAVITVGGFLGIGGRDVAVTYDSLNIVRNRKGDGIDHVVIAATKSDLRQAARFKSLHRQMAEAQSKR